MKELYQKAIQLTDELATMRTTIGRLEERDSSEKITLRDDDRNVESHIYSYVRTGAYLTFIHNEFKAIQKELKATQAEIKSKL